MIVIYHFNIVFFEGNQNILQKFNFLASGVDIFFIISGFLMFVGIEKRKYTFKSFLFARLNKIIPIYFAVTITLFLFDNFFNILPNRDLMLNDLIRSLTFTNIFIENKEAIHIIGWTLEYEFIFYLLVALAILFRFNIRKSLIFITSSILFLCVSLPNDHILKNFYFMEFLFGALAFFIIKYELYKKVKFVVTFLLSCGILFYIFYGRYTFLEGRFIFWGIPMLVIFLISFLINQKYPIKNLPNNLSYELYIYHLLVIKVIEKIGFMNDFTYIFNLSLTLFTTFLISYISNISENNLKKFFSSLLA